MKQIIGLFLVLVVGFIGCGGDKDSSTGPTEEPEGQTLEVETEWRKTFGGGRSYSVQQTVDGGFIVTGSDKNDNGDVLLLKTDGQGNEQWRKTFGLGRGYSVQQTVDGGFIVTGQDFSNDFVVLLLKTDVQGNEQWRKTFGDGYGLSVQQTVDGGFIVTGFDDNNDVVFLFKTDKLGNI